MRSFFVAVLLTGCGGAPRPVAQAPSRDHCSALVDHILDLAWTAHASEVSEGHGPIGSWNDGYGEDRHEYKKELRETQGAALLDRCSHSIAAHVECALAAETMSAVTTCDRSFMLADE